METKTIVLIDDDKLIHMSWKHYAKKQGHSIATFFTIQDFLAISSDFPKEALIYVDSQLSNGIRGEEESKLIYEAGFHNLYLATGYEDFDVSKYYWIKGVKTKKPAF